jgi:hypothetical protein
LALRSLKPEASGEFTFELNDDVVKENSGKWRVAFSPEGVDISPANSADLQFTVQQFTQAFLGDPNVLDLARNGLIEVRSREALRAASNLLTPSPVACWDFF